MMQAQALRSLKWVTRNTLLPGDASQLQEQQRGAHGEKKKQIPVVFCFCDEVFHNFVLVNLSVYLMSEPSLRAAPNHKMTQIKAIINIYL